MMKIPRVSLLLPGLLLALTVPSVAWANSPPATPAITEPAVDGQVVNPQDVHMETGPFSDPDPGDTHVCTDWEIHVASTGERVWSSLCNSVEKVHVHLGDGVFEGSLQGQTQLNYDTAYQLRVRDKDSSGDPVTQWSAFALRNFRTSLQPSPGTNVAWTFRQSGYQLEVVATGFQLPVNIAFLPNPGPNPSDPYFYVSELYGNIRVVSRDGTVSDYIRGALNYQPSGVFPGSGEQGLTGLVVDPISGDVFASMLVAITSTSHYPKVVRFHSNHNGTVAGSSTIIFQQPNEFMGESHQISNLTIGPDGKLYVHMGDGFDTSTALNLDSYRGKILRMNLDGTAPTDNPFYNAADGINARDYVFTYGHRNPFGGAWRAADGFQYEVENGPSVDRFAKVIRGMSYGWNGTDTSMSTGALWNWSPAVAPVNIAFIQSETFGGSGFPATKLGHAFVSESGPTYGTGPQTNGKRISEFVLNADGTRQSGPTPLIEYTGTGKATAAGLAAGPDGLYFTDLYKDTGTAATDVGANVMRIRPIGPPNAPPQVTINSPANDAGFTAPANIPITATATDPDGGVTRVEFFQGATKIGEDTTGDANNQFNFTWTNVPGGNYALTARATDNQGATATSTPVNLWVNNLPQVSINSPANNATFTPPATIPITATATDSGGTVVKVEFFQGTTKIGEDTTVGANNQFTFSWGNVPAGNYALTAVATDDKGATRTSSTVNVSVTTPPQVGINSPQNNATFTAPATIPITATATDNDGTVARVEFFQGTTKIGEDTTPDANNQFTVTWSNVAAGNYSLTARATDNQGAPATSAAVNVSVTNPNPPPTGTFAVSITPGTRQVRRGSATTYTVSVTPSGGMTGNVSLSAASLAGTTFSFSPNPVVINSANKGTSTLTVTTSGTTPLGRSTLTVTGSWTQNGTTVTRTGTTSMNVRQ